MSPRNRPSTEGTRASPSRRGRRTLAPEGVAARADEYMEQVLTAWERPLRGLTEQTVPFIVNAPLVGDILHRTFMARFARSFSMAYSAGVPIVQAMGVISRSIGNDFISSNVNGMREGIERGEALTRTADQTGMFTPVVMQMFAVGEEAGNLDEMMNFIADFYEEEVDYDVKTLSDKIEPLIYVAVGAMVLVLALGIFVPMWDVAQLATR